MEWPKITLLGDSITRRSVDPDNGCWASHVAYKTGNYFDVVARGFEGYNTRWCLELMPQLFPKAFLEKVEIFVIFLGHNDSWEIPFPPHVPATEYESNLRSIIKYLEVNGLEKRKVILITPTWFHKEEADKYMKSIGMPPLSKTHDLAVQYSEIVKKVAKENEIDCLDFFDISHKHEPLRELFSDGVHFSRRGAKVLYDHLMPIIEHKIKTSFGKPLDQLWHVIPFEQRQDVKDGLVAAGFDQEQVLTAFNKEQERRLSK